VCTAHGGTRPHHIDLEAQLVARGSADPNETHGRAEQSRRRDSREPERVMEAAVVDLALIGACHYQAGMLDHRPAGGAAALKVPTDWTVFHLSKRRKHGHC
jgi:hypothetical protein